MCRRIQCERCGKPSFAGCGAHIEQVLGDVPKAERCQCHAQKASSAEKTDKAGKSSWWKF